MKAPAILLSLGIILIAGSLAYEFVLKPDTNTSSPINQSTLEPPSSAVAMRDILTYVPADTLLFFGGLESTKFKDLLKVAVPEESWITEIDWEALKESEQAYEPLPAGVALMEGLFIEYMKALKTPETAATSLGIKEDIDSVLYTVGAIPVMRISLDNKDNFFAFIDRAEQQSKVAHTKLSLSGLELRLYNLEKSASNKPNTELVITEQNNYAVITFALEDKNRSTLLEQALGINKPTTSLADTSTLPDLKNKYNFHPGYLGYIDHTIIIKGLTNPQDNQFGVMIDGFIKSSLENTTQTNDQTPPENTGTKEHPLKTIQTPACQKELVEMVTSWPRSVLGYTKVSVEKQPLELQAKAVLEVNDASLLSSLKTLRGFIPGHLLDTNSTALFGFGLGFNIDALLPFLTQTFQNILQTPYECTPLKDMKQQLAASNGTAAIGMASGMLASLQGVSATVFHLDVDIDPQSQQPNIKALDALITLSAGNPQTFIMMAANFLPALASLQLPSDGTPMDFPIPLPFPLADTPKIAIKGKHIVAYIGEQGRQQAEKLANSPLEKNAILAMNINHSEYLKLLSADLTQTDSDQEAQATKDQLAAMSKAMGSVKTQMNQVIDISDHGISAEVNVTVQ